MNGVPTDAPTRGGALGNLWRLVRLSSARGLRMVALSAALTAMAATIDAASLILLRRLLGTALGQSSAVAAPVLLFLTAALVGTLARLLAQRATVTAQYEVNCSLALRAFGALQRQDYGEYLRRGASEGFAVFERLQLISQFGVTPLIAGISGAIGALVILAGIAQLYPLAAAAILFGLLAVGAETWWHAGRAQGGSLSRLAKDRSALLYEARNAFRHIFLTNGQERMYRNFATAETAYRLEQARTNMASQSSRQMIEIAGIAAAMAVLGIYSLSPAPATSAVPLMAVTALAVLRLMPQVSALRSAIRLIALHADVSADTIALLSQPPPAVADPQPVALCKALVLSSISLNRDDRQRTFDRLDLTIPRGARIGIRGESGIGKSSLLDIVCGALAPDAGTVAIDGVALTPSSARAWRERIGVVSQNPVPLGTTLREAVAFPQAPAAVDPERFAAALARAGVETMIAQFPRGLDTPIGEASTLLSGGQRQRLALAHALYRAQDLLILDEATGQLDPETEAAIVVAVRAMPRDLAVLVASHRSAAFGLCDVVYRLHGGRLIKDD